MGDEVVTGAEVEALMGKLVRKEITGDEVRQRLNCARIIFVNALADAYFIGNGWNQVDVHVRLTVFDLNLGKQLWARDHVKSDIIGALHSWRKLRRHLFDSCLEVLLKGED